jgi:tetratricopeptide (TPR) repeat protein
MKKLLKYSIIMECVTLSIAAVIALLIYFGSFTIVFEHGSYLFAYLFLFPLFWVYYSHCAWSSKAQKLLPKRFLDPNTAKRKKYFVSWFLLRNGIFFLIIALSQPFYGTQEEKGQSPSQDIVIAIDLSNSMSAEDIATNTSRLKVAQRVIEQLTTQLNGEKIGLAIFAGEAYLHLALTQDYNSVNLFANDLDPGIIENQGTNIANALYVSSQLFPTNSKRQKRILVLTDGEDHLGGVSEALTEVEDLEIGVSFCAIGTERGGKIPEDPSMPEDFFKKDKDGNDVISKPNITMIKDLANQAHEQAFWYNTAFPNTEELSKTLVSKNIRFSTSNYTTKRDWYQVFSMLSLLFLIGYCWVYFKLSLPWKQTLLVCIISFFSLHSNSLLAQTKENTNYLDHIRKAKELYRAQQYPASAKELLIANGLNPKQTKKYQAEFAQALYRNGQFEPAAEIFKKIATEGRTKMQKATANYNYGNAMMQQKKYQDAVDAYKNALRQNPGNPLAKYNYARAKSRLKQQKKQNPPPKDDKKNNKKDPNQDKNKNKNKNDEPKNDPPKKNEPKDKKDDGKMTDQQYKQMLDRINRQERETRKKLNAKTSNSLPQNNEKDW